MLNNRAATQETMSGADVHADIIPRRAIGSSVNPEIQSELIIERIARSLSRGAFSPMAAAGCSAVAVARVPSLIRRAH